MLRVAEQYAGTDTGRQRRANEDSLLARAPLFVVADGMGGSRAGEVASRLLDADVAAAETAAREYQAIFGEDYFLEVQEHGLPEQAHVNEGLRELSQRMPI